MGAQADAESASVYGVIEKDGVLLFDPQSTGKPIPDHVIKAGAETWEHAPAATPKRPTLARSGSGLTGSTSMGR